MDLDTLIQLFTISGSSAGFGAIYLAWKQYKRNQPDIKCFIEQGEYKRISKSRSDKEHLQITCNFVINNSGGAPTSLISCKSFLRMRPEKELSPAILETSAGGSFPYEIKADGSSKIKLTSLFELAHPFLTYHFLDRCLVPIDLENPKKWEWDDLPIIAKFVFKHTKGYFETESCIFREDLPESQRRHDGFDWHTYYDVRDSFSPNPAKK